MARRRALRIMRGRGYCVRLFTLLPWLRTCTGTHLRSDVQDEVRAGEPRASRRAGTERMRVTRRVGVKVIWVERALLRMNKVRSERVMIFWPKVLFSVYCEAVMNLRCGSRHALPCILSRCCSFEDMVRLHNSSLRLKVEASLESSDALFDLLQIR